MHLVEEIRIGSLMVSFASIYQVPTVLVMSESKTIRRDPSRHLRG